MEIEVFKTGVHRDSAGNVREWTEGDLDQLAANYNSRQGDAPVVIGHPKSDSPAYGWVNGLQRKGNILTASLKDVNPDFQQMVKNGAFRNRSVAVNADMSLRHVGFLGATPPAIQGLKPVEFKDDGTAALIEFSIAQPVTDKQPDVGRPRPDWQLKQSTGSEFAELNTLREKVTQLEREGRKKDFTAFCDSLVSVGKITPAQKPRIAEFMEIMHNVGAFEFSEDGNRPAVEAFKEFVSSLPTQVHMKEMATKEFAADNCADNPDVALGKKIADSLNKKKQGGK
ncbi:MAG: hypothetical protein HQK97_04515 [Nitrospirae bacterium]|nr:hypothetical protein [Nitrospirota bacterium]